MLMDFACAGDGSSGTFSEDGMTFTQDTPGWTALIADRLGTLVERIKKESTDDLLCLSSRESEASQLRALSLWHIWRR